MEEETVAPAGPEAGGSGGAMESRRRGVRDCEDCGEERTKLLRAIMGLRGMRRPPFLIRSLSYVRDAKRKLGGLRGFDIRWARCLDNTDAKRTTSCRRLVLRVIVQYCALKNVDWDRFVPVRHEGSESDGLAVGINGKERDKAAVWNRPGARFGAVTRDRSARTRMEQNAMERDRTVRNMQATTRGRRKNKNIDRGPIVMEMGIYFRLWLVVEDHDHYRTAAGVREMLIETLSVEDDLRNGVDHDGKNIGDFSFDLGGVLAMASSVSTPRRVLLKVELSKDTRGQAILVSELCLFDAYRGKSWIPTLAVELPLRKTSYAEKLYEERRKRGKETHDTDENDQEGEGRCKYFEREDWVALTFPPKNKSYVSLRLSGQPENDDLVSNLTSQALRKRSAIPAAARIDLTYTAAEKPGWKLVRHDFRCPFCLRNHNGLRALWTHLSTDHEKREYSVRAAPDAKNPKLGEYRRVSLVVTFKAGNYNLDPPTSPASDDPPRQSGPVIKNEPRYLTPVKPGTEEIYVNPVRFRNYYESIPFGKESDAEASDDVLEVVNDYSEFGSEFGSDDTDFDEKLVEVDPIRSRCLHCSRLHPSRYQVDRRFCGDFCHIRYEEKTDPTKSLSQIAEERPGYGRRNQLRERGSMTRTRRKSDLINFKETLGKRTLYHETTYVPVTAEHYDECSGDSEEEIDESWRLDLLNERVVDLPDVEPAEKVLMKMWNTYMHKHPLHGDRYVRYQCEMFAFENGAEINRLGLRGVFFDFLRECIYAYGLTDTEGVASIFEALDGRKKRKDIVATRKAPTDPPPLSHGTSRGPGMRPSTRGPRTRKNNNHGKKKRNARKGSILGGVSKGTRPPMERVENSSDECLPW